MSNNILDIQPLSPARVAVLASVSHTSHYGYASTEIFAYLASHVTPWIQFLHYDETTLTSLHSELQRNALHGLVVASGALQSPANRRFLNESVAEELQDLILAGMGIVVLHQYLGNQKEGINLAFFPEGCRAELRGCTPRTVTYDQLDTSDFRLFVNAPELSLRTQRHRRASSGRTVEHKCVPAHDVNWSFTNCAEDSSCNLVMRSDVVGRSFAAVSMLPFDWDWEPAALGALIARSVRRTGLLEGGDASAVAARQQYVLQHIAGGGHVSSAGESDSVGSLVSASAAHFFSRVLAGPDLSVDGFDDDLTESLAERLENGGAFGFFPMDDPDDGVFVELEGRPPYAKRADQVARRVTELLPELDSATTFDLRGFALLCRVCDDTFRDTATISPSLSLSIQRDRIKRIALSRIRKGSVDNSFLPTCAVASALLQAGLGNIAVDLLRWIRGRGPFVQQAPIDELAQSLIWIPELQEGGELGAWIHGLPEEHRSNSPFGMLVSAVVGDQPDQLIGIIGNKNVPSVLRAEAVLVAHSQGIEIDLELTDDLRLILEGPRRGDFASIEVICLVGAALIVVESQIGPSAWSHSSEVRDLDETELKTELEQASAALVAMGTVVEQERELIVSMSTSWSRLQHIARYLLYALSAIVITIVILGMGLSIELLGFEATAAIGLTFTIVSAGIAVSARLLKVINYDAVASERLDDE